MAESDDVQSRVNNLATEGCVALAEEDPAAALVAFRRCIDAVIEGEHEFAHEAVRIAFPDAVEAALAVPDLEAVRELIELVATRPPGEVPPFLRAQGARAEALFSAAEGRVEEVEEGLVGAEATFRELGYPYWTARAQLDRAEWLARQGRAAAADALADEAAKTFERLESTPALARVRAISKATAEVG